MVISRGIERLAKEQPGAPALLAPGAPPLTTTGLVTRIGGIARTLAAAGIRRGNVVAMVEPDGIDFLCLFLGIAAVGACAPVNPALSRSELEFYLPDLQPDALVVRRLDSPAAAQGRLRSLKILETGQLLAEAAKVLPGVPSDGPEPEDVALLLHTSATTGRAKLVPLTHREVLAMAENTATLLGLNRQDRFLSMMPLFHLQGLISAVAQLNRGGSVVATPGLDPVRFPAWMEEFRPTWYTAAPALHGAILPVARREKERIRNAPLRFVRSIGARLAPQLLAGVEEALGVPVLEGNGLTETGMVTSNPLPPGRRLPGSAGTAAAAEVAILDEQGVPVEPGRQGQIAVRGPTVFSGYRNDDEANRAAFRDGWFLTGDLGWLDKEGYLFIDGRLKEMINRGGAKVLPGEVDDWLMAHPAVARAAAFAMPHPMLGEEVAAAVVLRAGASATAAELRRYAASQLSSFKVPRRILFLDALPVSATGKPVRAKLAEMLAAEVRSCQPPQTETQKRLARVWEKVLGVERVGLHDDFFSLGGDSFALTLLMTELEIEFGTAAVGLQDSEFFASPDLENLAGLLDGHSSARHPIGAPQRPPYIALQREGARQPFFSIPGADENPYYFRELAQCLGEDRPFYVIRDPQPIEERELLTLEQSAVRYAAVIRSLRPRGPYVVGGHCFGGVLAFEIARELMRRGERVARVVLFETPAPGHPKVLRHWRRYGRVAAGILTGRRRVSRNEIFAHLGLLLSLGRRRMPVLSALSLPDTHPNVRAMAAYRPRRLDCAVTQFVATAEFHRTEILDCPLRAWREYAGSEFDLQETAGPAEAIFRYPHVRTLAEKLREVLGRIEEGQ